MALHDQVLPLIVAGRIAELADALIDLPGYALTNLPAGAIGPALDWLVDAGRLDEALVLYHSAHAVQASLPLPLRIAEALQAQGRQAMAVDLLAGWRDGARKRPGEYVGQANALEALAGPGAALPVIAAAAQAFPQSGAFAAHHARLLMLLGDPAAAMAALDRGLEADPIQPPWVRAFRAALAGAPVPLGRLTLELPLAALGPARLLAILHGTHRAGAEAAARAVLAPGTRLHDAAAGAGELALRLARAVPGAEVTAFDPRPDLAALLARNLAANGQPAGLEKAAAPDILILPLGADGPEVPPSVTRLIAEPDPALPPAVLTAHLGQFLTAGFVLNLAAGGPDLIVLDRPA